jgi:hypothetical protein
VVQILGGLGGNFLSAADKMDYLDAVVVGKHNRGPVLLTNDLVIELDRDAALRERQSFDKRAQIDAVGYFPYLAIYNHAHKKPPIRFSLIGAAGFKYGDV